MCSKRTKKRNQPKRVNISHNKMPKNSILPEETKVDDKASPNRSKRQNQFYPNKETIEVKKVRTNADSNSAFEKGSSSDTSLIYLHSIQVKT